MKSVRSKSPCPIWLNSQYSLTPNLDIIDKVPSNISILIQHGENDSHTPIQQAFLLQQKLTEVRHPDHTLITYPNLGHLFYPSSQWVTAVEGPMGIKSFQKIFMNGFRIQSDTSSDLPFFHLKYKKALCLNSFGTKEQIVASKLTR